MSILIITNQADITSDFIVRKLQELQLPFFRLNTEQIGKSLTVTFDFSESNFMLFESGSGKTIDLSMVTSVYYRRPEINRDHGDLSKGEQSFIHAELLYVLEGLYKILDNAYWINKVQSIRNAENKIYQLLIAEEIGFNIPESLITSDPNAALQFYNKHNQQCIIKPIKSGLVQDDHEEGVIFTSKVVLDENNVNRIVSCPVYLQKLINKDADIRVTLVGNQVFAAKIHSQENAEGIIDWRKAGVPLPHSVIELPRDIKYKCIKLLEKLQLNYGAVDFILTEGGQYVFLEINPNGQWAWIENRLNLKISDAITGLLSANVLA